ncbi:hypothetical protein [Streptomyces sp. NBC_00691]|uniref:hypothetical protein n=1 Tax=Streptomyces sp. NBC_00691 TaxID=2903671 RepID=UPI002E2F5C48|nr:hypothetical protein [Streptomyces sp. NBC_00691]
MDASDEGRHPDEQWTDEGNNVCGTVRGLRDASRVAARFAGAGWNSHPSSWHGHEVETGWCRLEIDPMEAGAVLLNGAVDPTRLDDLAALLAAFGLPYALELADEHDTVIREING